MDPGCSHQLRRANLMSVPAHIAESSPNQEAFSCCFLIHRISLGLLLSAESRIRVESSSPSSPPSSLHPLSSVAGVKSSLLSSHQSAGIWSMPRSLCVAKRQIKETVISSAASAADSCVAVAEGGGGAGRGYTSAKCLKGESGREGRGRRRRRMGQQTVGQRLDTRFYSCHEPSGEKQEGEMMWRGQHQRIKKGGKRLEQEEKKRCNIHPELAGDKNRTLFFGGAMLSTVIAKSAWWKSESASRHSPAKTR